MLKPVSSRARSPPSLIATSTNLPFSIKKSTFLFFSFIGSFETYHYNIHEIISKVVNPIFIVRGSSWLSTFIRFNWLIAKGTPPIFQKILVHVPLVRDKRAYSSNGWNNSTCLHIMAFSSLAGNGADCGPSNPMAGLMKQFHQDRSLQQVPR